MRRAICITLCTSILAFAAATHATAEISLVLSTSNADAGSEVEISWHAEGSSNVFLTGYGVVKPSGSRKFRAIESTIYVLIAEGASGISTMSQSLSVHGGKGHDIVDLEAFSDPLRELITVTSFTTFCDRLQSILQNNLGFSVRPFEIPREKFLLITNASIRPELASGNEPRIGARRLAYLVELTLPAKLPAEIQVTISTSIQYQRWMEATWRPDDSEILHRQAAKRLRQLILAAAKASPTP